MNADSYVMSPIKLDYLLQVYWRPAEPQRATGHGTVREFPASVVVELLRDALIEDPDDGGAAPHALTERGRVYIRALLAMPLPVMTFTMPHPYPTPEEEA